MQNPLPFSDIHCHLVPGIDDGAADLETSLAMARMAVADGIETIIATPHQLGNFRQNRGDAIRQAVASLQAELKRRQIPLQVLAGGDVRIEDGMLAGLQSGSVLTLGDHRRHVLLELPHELYLPLDVILRALERQSLVGILSHPERNRGLLARPEATAHLVSQGCLMQITAGSLNGSFGMGSQQMSEWMLREGLVHFVATDAHGIDNRRPKMRRAFERVAALVGEDIARLVCCENPGRVARGQPVAAGRVPLRRAGRWFGRRASA